MFIILTLIIIVAAFNIISGLTILIKNKTKEIAIIKTLGLSDSSIIKAFFLTGFTIGLLATLSGIFFGVLFSVYIDEIRNFLSMFLGINIFPSDIYYLEKMPSEIKLGSILMVFTLSIIITSIASYFPAKTISKLKSNEALNMNRKILDIKNLNKNFYFNNKKIEVLKNSSFSINRGELVALTGPSGSGKSTLLHLVSFMDKPSSGKIFF